LKLKISNFSLVSAGIEWVDWGDGTKNEVWFHSYNSIYSIPNLIKIKFKDGTFEYLKIPELK